MLKLQTKLILILNVSIQKKTPICQLAKNYVHFEQIREVINTV